MRHLILSSLLLGTSLGKIIARILAPNIPFQLFDTNIPGVSQSLANLKTYDLVEFALTVIFSFAIFGVNYYFQKNKGSISNTLRDISYLIFSIIVFIQTHFVTMSGKTTIIVILIGQLTYLFLRKKKMTLPKDPNLIVANGFIAGFVLMLIANSITTSIALSLIALFMIPFTYLFFGSTLTRNPLHLLLLLSIFDPTNLTFLVLLLILIFIAILISSNFLKEKYKYQAIVREFLYPIAIITLLTYNPLFHTGNLDTIEEGFWLAWLQRLINGDVLYRDVTVYHPPLIPWSMYGFTSIFGYTIKNTRLFLHILQILGFTIYYFVVNDLLKSKISKAVVFSVMLGLTTTFVRNNVEIRVGLGLLSLLFWSKFVISNKVKFLYFTGISNAISLFVSMEVGLAVIATIIVSTVLFYEERFRYLGKYFLGTLIITLPIFTYMFVTESIEAFFVQTFFYASSFSKGYFNQGLERAIQVSNLRWHLIWQYFSSTALIMEFTRMTFLGGLIYFFTQTKINIRKKVINLTSSNDKDKFVFALSIFGLLLFRSVLGRSDYFHILFVAIIAIPLLFYFVERTKNKNLNVIVALIFLTVFAGNKINEGYLSRRLFTYTTYGEIVSKYKVYNADRSDILVGVEVNQNETNEIIEYIQSNTSEEESIFIYPWNPELYFLTNRKNATSFDTPYSFWSENHQLQLIEELEKNNPKIVVTNAGSQFGQMDMNSLPIVNKYIEDNYDEVKQIYSFRVLK